MPSSQPSSIQQFAFRYSVVSILVLQSLLAHSDITTPPQLEGQQISLPPVLPTSLSLCISNILLRHSHCREESTRSNCSTPTLPASRCSALLSLKPLLYLGFTVSGGGEMGDPQNSGKNIKIKRLKLF